MQKIPKIILLIEADRGFGRELLRGIAKYSRLHGPWSFYREPPFFRDLGRKKKILHRIKNWHADGIITRLVAQIEDIVATGVPTIVAASTNEGVPTGILDSPTVTTDNVAAGEMAAEHLLERGFTRFAYCGFEEIQWSVQRGESFARKVTQAGHEINFYRRSKSRALRSWDAEQPLVADWLRSLPKPVGLMACTDDRSGQVVEACKLVGLHVPEEVAIVGVDNDRLVCNLSNPPLSSVALAAERSGYEAAELLDKLMAGTRMAKQKIIIQPTHVVSRQSTDILAIEDSEVAAAVGFIREHANETIQVQDVVDAVALSRRGLERRIRKVLGRSVLAEIRRVRVEQVARMLAETNLPVSQIALALGFDGVDHIARYFRREKGMSPLKYRKENGQK
jgi:LacI family transcriptional regulator